VMIGLVIDLFGRKLGVQNDCYSFVVALFFFASLLRGRGERVAGGVRKSR